MHLCRRGCRVYSHWLNVFGGFLFVIIGAAGRVRGDQVLLLETLQVDSSHSYERSIDLQIPWKQTVTIFTETIPTDNRQDYRDPVEVIAKLGGSVLYWKLDSGPISQDSRRTLCPSNSTLQLTVTTASPAPLHLLIRVQLDPYILTLDEPLTALQVSHTRPHIFYYQFSEQVEEVFVSVRNQTEAICSLVSVQTANYCPFTNFPYTDEDIKLGQTCQYQTVLEKASLTINREDFANGFILSVLVKQDDSLCYSGDRGYTVYNPRNMNFTVSINTIHDLRLKSTLTVLGAYIFIGILSVCIALWFCKKHNMNAVERALTDIEMRVKQKQELHGGVTATVAVNKFKTANKRNGEEEHVVDSCAADDMAHVVDSWATADIAYVDSEEVSKESDRSPAVGVGGGPTAAVGVGGGPTAAVEESGDVAAVDGDPSRSSNRQSWHEKVTTFDSLENRKPHRMYQGYTSVLTKEEKNAEVTVAVRLKPRASSKPLIFPTVADYCLYLYEPPVFTDYQHSMSNMYLWLVLLMGMFYSLPVLQLVLYHQDSSVQSGNLDVCYFNYECYHPWGIILDYGNIFSNVGYVVCGLFFLAIVHSRERAYIKFVTKTQELQLERYNMLTPTQTGIPELYGIYYALGWALVGEGILSASYHICPTGMNFQFDTTFMYTIAILIFLKVYQFRHPDITPSALKTFALIGLMLYIEVVGYLVDHIVFWILFCILYLVLINTVILNLYLKQNNKSMDIWKVSFWQKGVCQVLNLNSFQAKPVLVIIVANIALAIFIVVMHTPGVSSYILLIISLNMALYLNYYVYCKLYYRYGSSKLMSEGIRWVTLLYLFLSFACLGVSGYFFLSIERSSSLTPAESRGLNEPCLIGIFDNHDLWHFLSASGIFYGYMFLLTLEDKNIPQPRDKIPAF